MTMSKARWVGAGAKVPDGSREAQAWAKRSARRRAADALLNGPRSRPLVPPELER